MKRVACRSEVCWREHDRLSPVQCQTSRDHEDVLWRRYMHRQIFAWKQTYATFNDKTLSAFLARRGRHIVRNRPREGRHHLHNVSTPSRREGETHERKKTRLRTRLPLREPVWLKGDAPNRPPSRVQLTIPRRIRNQIVRTNMSASEGVLLAFSETPALNALHMQSTFAHVQIAAIMRETIAMSQTIVLDTTHEGIFWFVTLSFHPFYQCADAAAPERQPHPAAVGAA